MMPSSSNTDRWERTNLRLVAQNDSSNSATREEEYYLCLPTSSSDDDDDQQQQLRARRLLQFMALDRYLASVPQLADSTRQLLLSAVQNHHHRPKVITSSNSGRVINVLQGEIAHCTPTQADVLVSDDATTCHILGLWSRLCYSSSSSAQQHYQMQQQPKGRDGGGGSASTLATLAHIDSPHYQDCIKDAVNLHYQYHCSQLPYEQQQQQQQRTQLNGEDTFLPVIELSIHLMGGYNDGDGTSHEITDGVLRALANVSDDYVSRQPRLQMTLQTCAVLSANDNGSGCPIGRGLALDVSSGRVYLAEVEEEDLESSSPQVNTTVASTTVVTTASAKGPDCLLRSARLWASFFFNNSDDNDSGNIQRKLQTVHNPNNDYLYIYPFYFAPHPYPQQMLTLNDARLLRYTSSSPDVEKDNFVRCVRETFKYINRTSCFQVFKKRETDEEGDDNDGWDYGWDDGDYLPRRYRRVGLNGWAIVA